MFRQLAVELGDHRRAQGLQPHPADAGHDVMINVMAVSGERLGFHGCGVRLDPFSQVISDGRG